MSAAATSLCSSASAKVGGDSYSCSHTCNGRRWQSMVSQAAGKRRRKWQSMVTQASGKRSRECKKNEAVEETGAGGGGEESSSLTLDDVNPVGLGRKSRQLFDEVWRKFSGLGQISRTIRDDDDSLLIREGPMCEFAIPGAQSTTVLVVGATSRVGTILVRKLMLRGYSVKVC